MIGYVLADAAAVPASDSWLTASERRRCAGLRIEKRRADWRAGRWVAKHAVGRALDVHPLLIEIRSGPSGAPQPWCGGRPLPVALSLSHSTGRALSVVSTATPDIGCDLELVEARHPAFAGDWFTASEQRTFEAAGDDRDTLITAVWCAKESVLKALRAGLLRDTRSVVVGDAGTAHDGWLRLTALDTTDQRWFDVWVCRDGPMVVSVAAAQSASDPSAAPPRRL